jgi:hypothetical protein
VSALESSAGVALVRTGVGVESGDPWRMVASKADQASVWSHRSPEARDQTVVAGAVRTADRSQSTDRQRVTTFVPLAKTISFRAGAPWAAVQELDPLRHGR